MILTHRQYRALLWGILLFIIPTEALSQDVLKNISADIGVSFTYDDNILQTRTLKESDLIIEPSLFVKYTSPSPSPTSASIDITLDRYQDTSDLNYETFRFGIEQALGAVSDLSLEYSLIPNFPLDIQDPGVPPLEYQSHLFDLTLDTDLTSEFSALVSGKVGTRNYSSPFDARDTTVLGAEVEGTYWITRDLRATGEYRFEKNSAAGGRIPLPLGETRPDDITSRSHLFSLRTTYRIEEPLFLRFGYSFRQRRYTTNETGDTFHFGRQDRTHHILAGARYRTPIGIGIRGDYEILLRRSNLAFVNFVENLLTLAFTYSF